MAEWILMLFEMVSGVGLGLGVLDFGGDRRKEGPVLWGIWGVPL